ncbi:N-acetyltransferase [Citrobacter sp. JGM124]|uniref:N-acetyltransferase n=1 Tax=Citrobacter sp. JGM124 TaxID=2799789 RepID=UPI001BACB17E|nr:N-acetyltransferase [Citrobacter sp. JGM124]MBS0848092.1 N-acetyltransferase [Citrobacter sp. JGM124]
MIHPYEPSQLDALMTLWLKSTMSGHPFIAKSYWHESSPLVRNVYIPQSKTWVYMQEEKLVGFVSVLEQQFLGALFVDPLFVGKGIGTCLVCHAQSCYSTLRLEVYQKNRRAVDFYRHRGFYIEGAAWQHETRHSTWIMRWEDALR